MPSPLQHSTHILQTNMAYIPKPILTDIVRRVGRSGFRYLGPFIAAGSFRQSIVFSSEVLSEVNLDDFVFNSRLANLQSQYRPFLLQCLSKDNHTAQYVEGLRRLAQEPPSQDSLDMLGTTGPHLLYARFAFAIFLLCCGSVDQGFTVLETFLQKAGSFDIVEAQIRNMGTREVRPYARYMHFNRIPYCCLDHFTEIDVCSHCFGFTYACNIEQLC